ncbi:C40 family peptidase [Isoptericola sp. NEAU-Y5]|uniref:C40 family peptidase n=1 Tax=Isoptericola luteus TaxID=2879484 RepID=A0ABS7ZKP9_9MICO|nr:C40 family peptidase [Isoptericola sp. NEAU-Y5]MCA5894424.1 C40 family peptidase [Isoptericola sp. NEAU-Y5]
MSRTRPTARAHDTGPGRRPARTAVRIAAVRITAVLVPLLLAVTPTAGATGPLGSDRPSDDDVAAAHEAVDAAELDVGGAQDRLDAIRAELATAEAAVQTAAEDYAEAQEAVRAAQAAAHEAREQAERARAAQGDVRAAIADAYRSTARGADGVGPLTVVTGSRDLGDIVAGESAQRAVDRKNAAAFVAHADLRATAERADARWRAARAELAEAREAAKAAFDTARRTADDLTARTAAAQDERDRLYARLGQLRSTSAEIERQREQARQEQVDRARERAAREAAEAAAAPAAGSPEPARSSAPDPRPTSDPEPAPEPTRTAEPEPEPEPETPPVSGVGQGSAAQGREALAWARSKIGTPYEWGGEGDPGYDCSGLTSQAWNAAGVWITRTSRSQYLTVGKVPYDRMRPGDLIFYANDTSDPATIRHVAIYAGDGMMVEAPRPGIDVRETPVRWAETMPHAGRP